GGSYSALRKRFRSFYDSSPSPTLPVRKRYRGTSELILGTDSLEDKEVEESLESDSESEDVDDVGPTAEDEDPAAEDKGLAAGVEGLDSDELSLGEEEVVPEGQQQAILVVGTAMSEPLGLGYGALMRRELTLEEDHVYSTFKVGQGFGSAREPGRSERVSTFRKPTLTKWTDMKDGMVYIDVPVYPLLAPLVQTPPSTEWTSGLLPISPSPYVVPSAISSAMIQLTIPSPIASPIATSTTTISVDEDQFIEAWARLELYRCIV
nr:hypothetical protein [Tanacetum cinerariifolium]